MAGYSGTPLPKKLGIKPGHRVLVLGAPEGFALDVEDVSLRQHGDAFIATRIDGTTLGVFASLDAALDAIEGELIGADDEA